MTIDEGGPLNDTENSEIFRPFYHQTTKYSRNNAYFILVLICKYINIHVSGKEKKTITILTYDAHVKLIISISIYANKHANFILYYHILVLTPPIYAKI